MIIGLPKEIKDNEYRVAMVPSGLRAAVEAGHTVLVERGAGFGSDISDEEFEGAGAEMVATAEELFSRSDLVVKVKEPQPVEYAFLREGLIVLTFFHLAADRGLLDILLKTKTTAIAYETLKLADRSMPILEPMSEVAGRLAVQIGAHYLLRSSGGRGVLLSGVPGVEKGEVLIIGAGTVGQNAIKIASGLDAEVTVLDTDLEKLRHIDELYGSRVNTLLSNTANIEEAVAKCDLLIGAVHIPGARTPKIVTREMVKTMKKGSVVIDVAVDQGGSVETICATTHSDPVYVSDGVLHYGVTNMPGSVPRTSTYALTNATLPYLLALSESGLKAALLAAPALITAVNTYNGHLTNRAVAESFDLSFTELSEIL